MDCCGLPKWVAPRSDGTYPVALAAQVDHALRFHGEVHQLVVLAKSNQDLAAACERGA